jgi:hypothetical protein
MTKILDFRQNLELSTPGYHPKLYVLLGHYCTDNQHFVPIIDLNDWENPKFSILRLNKKKVVHIIIVDSFIDNTIIIKNEKGQQTAWTFGSHDAFAETMEIIGRRYKGEIITKVKNDNYSIEFCHDIFTDRNHCTTERVFLELFDYIKPGFYANWGHNRHMRHCSEEFAKTESQKKYYLEREIDTPLEFYWPKSEFIKY